MRGPGDFCHNCGRDPVDFPMTFRGEIFCSDQCRKALGIFHSEAEKGSYLSRALLP